VHKLPIVLREK